MEPSLDLDIRAHLADYLASVTSLTTFEEWFVPNALAHVEEGGGILAEDLAYGVEHELAQFAHGDFPETELRRRLLPYVTSYEAQVHR